MRTGLAGGTEPRLLDRFDTMGKFRYRAWRLLRKPWPLRVRLRSGEEIELRPSGSDWSVAREVFALEIYRLPPAASGRPITHIVDLGGNVGFTTLYWLWRMPSARVTAYEPHPTNAERFRAHVTRNRLAERVTLHPVAAGACDRTIRLQDAGSSSSAVIDRAGEAGGEFHVPMVDWFAHLNPARPIDLLKLDIEGGEYELLSDPRFAGLAVGVVVMEWHTVPGTQYGRRWCIDRLESLGYQIYEPDEPPVGSIIGMLWATRG